MKCEKVPNDEDFAAFNSWFDQDCRDLLLIYPEMEKTVNNPSNKRSVSRRLRKAFMAALNYERVRVSYILQSNPPANHSQN